LFWCNLVLTPAAIAWGLAPSSFAAAESPAQAVQPRFEMWTGAEVFQQVWSLYAGGSYAPFGSVREDGFRVRAVAGYGAYTYSSPRWTGLATQIVRFHGSTTFADLLAGYHQQLGSLTIKILGGLTVADRMADDPDASNQATRAGGKAIVETWWNVTDQVWASVDLSWSALDNVYGTRARVGWRWWPEFSVGLEGGAAGSFDYDTARLGGFVRYEWAAGELSVSGGVSGDGPSNRWVDVHGPFATVNVLTRF
jgi:Cellulose biosynthesis protein BcsS